MFPDPSPPPVPPPVFVQQQKRSGLGCFGIGCVVLILVLLLIGGLVVLMSYLGVSTMGKIASTVPATTQTVDAGDTVYQAAEDKVATFQQAQQQQRPASIELTSDEINTMIARDSDFTNNHIHLLVTMSGNRMHLQGSFPADSIPVPFGLLKDKFLNGSADFSPSYDPMTKNLNFKLYGLQFGSQVIAGSQLDTIQTQLSPMINSQLHISPNTSGFLEHLQTLEVRDGKLELQMK